MTKKQFTDTICKTFDLKGITPNSFVYAVNCILIGIVMVKVPGRKPINYSSPFFHFGKHL